MQKKTKGRLGAAVVLLGLGLALSLSGTVAETSPQETAANEAADTVRIYSSESDSVVELAKVVLDESEWEERLSRLQYDVIRRKGTERAFTGKYWKSKEKGIYRCAACGTDLFRSSTKYDSGTGWPSFWEPIAKENIATALDESWFSRRIEVLCARCDGHLGHVFSDGPRPTGLRYCINSVSLEFVAD